MQSKNYPLCRKGILMWLFKARVRIHAKILLPNLIMSSRISRATNRIRVSEGGTTVIELAIQQHDDPAKTCHICANSLCRRGDCCRAGVHLACCTQILCAKCLLKICKRCRCDDQCVAVIGFCPYCRDISPVNALDLFKGTMDECSRCQQPPPPPIEQEEEGPQEATISQQHSSGESEGSIGLDYFLSSVV